MTALSAFFAPWSKTTKAAYRPDPPQGRCAPMHIPTKTGAKGLPDVEALAGQSQQRCAKRCTL